MAELYVQIDKNDIEYEITAKDGNCSHPKSYKDKINPNLIGSIDTITVKDYSCYIHGLSNYYDKNRDKIKTEFSLSPESELELELLVHVSGNKIQLFNKDGSESNLIYTKNNHDSKVDINVYFNKGDKEPYDIPILFKYESKFFAPKNKDSYFKRWDEVDESSTFTKNNSSDLNNFINSVYNKLTEVDLLKSTDYGIPFNNKLYEIDKFSTKRYKLETKNHSNFKTVTHKHVSHDYIEHDAKIGNIKSVGKCLFDNEHLTTLSQSDIINEVVVFFRKDDENYKNPAVVLLNNYSRSIRNSTTYGYYDLTKQPESCNKHKFIKLKTSCGLDQLLGEEVTSESDDDIDEDAKKLKKLVEDISQSTISPHACRCDTDVSVPSQENSPDSSGIEAPEETEHESGENIDKFMAKPESSTHKITFKTIPKPERVSTNVQRVKFVAGNYTKVTYSPKTILPRDGDPYDLYKQNLFKVGVKFTGQQSVNFQNIQRCTTQGQCEDITFDIPDSTLGEVVDSKFDFVYVYFITKTHTVLMVEFHNDSNKHQFVRISNKKRSEWAKAKVPDNYVNYKDLIVLLKKIESNLDTFILLIDKDSTYKSTDIQESIKNAIPSVYLSPYQSTSISVTQKPLHNSDYKHCTHRITINDNTSVKHPLRLFLSTGTEVELYSDKDAKKKENIEYKQGQSDHLIVYLFKQSNTNKPLLLSYRNKVYQPKLGETNTNKWVIVSNSTISKSSPEEAKGSILLKKKLCAIKDTIYPTGESVQRGHIEPGASVISQQPHPSPPSLEPARPSLQRPQQPTSLGGNVSDSSPGLTTVQSQEKTRSSEKKPSASEKDSGQTHDISPTTDLSQLTHAGSSSSSTGSDSPRKDTKPSNGDVKSTRDSQNHVHENGRSINNNVQTNGHTNGLDGSGGNGHNHGKESTESSGSESSSDFTAFIKKNWKEFSGGGGGLVGLASIGGFGFLIYKKVFAVASVV